MLENPVRKKIVFTISAIRKTAMVYLALPALVFCLGFLRAGIGIPTFLGVLVALFCAIKSVNRKTVDTSCAIPPVTAEFSSSIICSVCLISLLWCIVCGQGGMVVQKWDWNFRNACFRDLITHSWPVIYKNFNNALVYYVGHWLPPAAIARIEYICGGGIETAWPLGNLMLLVWTTSGVVLSLLLYLSFFRVQKAFSLFFLVVFYFAFGGLDAVVEFRQLLSNLTGRSPFSIIENWAVFAAMENKTSQLAWVFHQAVPTWVATLLVLHDTKASCWAFLLTMLSLSAPLPCCGLFLMMGIMLLVQFVLQGRLYFGSTVRSMVTIQNLIGLMLIFVFGAYLVANPAVGKFSLWDLKNPVVMAMFVLGEFGIYAFMIWRPFGTNCWFYPTIVVLLIASFVHIGHRADFSMRVSIPALLVLQIFLAKILVAPSFKWRLSRYARILIVVILFLGFGGAAVDVASTVQRTFWFKTDVDDSDQIFSFDRDLTPEHIERPFAWWDWRYHLENFFVANPDEHFFFRHLAKQK